MNLTTPTGIISALAFAALTLWNSACQAEQHSSAQGAASLRAVDDVLRDIVERGAAAGASLLLLKDGEALYRRAVGNLTVDDRVRIASSTKPVAAAAILMLVDAGKLALDDRLAEALPEFKGTAVADATLRQLLSHTGGIAGDYPGGRPKRGSLAEFSRLIARKGTLRAPGGFRYSGVSIDIACRMAEMAAGEPIEDYILKNLWQPLGMTHSSFSIAADPNSVSAQQRSDGEGRYVSCGGGMTSSTDDMAAFYTMLVNGGVYRDQRLLSQEAWTEMTRRQARNPKQTLDPSSSGEYGLGLYRDRVAADGSPLTISHAGSLGSMAWADLDSGLVGVFLTDSQLRRVMPYIVKLRGGARGVPEAGRAGNADTDAPAAGTPAAGTPAAETPVATSQQEKAFYAISDGGDRINLKQFEEFVETQSNRTRLKGDSEKIQRLFFQLDANGDGVLMLEEYIAVGGLRR